MKEAEALWAVARHEPATSGDVATALGDKRQEASRILKTLWENKLVERRGMEMKDYPVTQYEYRLSEEYERCGKDAIDGNIDTSCL